MRIRDIIAHIDYATKIVIRINEKPVKTFGRNDIIPSAVLDLYIVNMVARYNKLIVDTLESI